MSAASSSISGGRRPRRAARGGGIAPWPSPQALTAQQRSTQRFCGFFAYLTVPPPQSG